MLNIKLPGFHKSSIVHDEKGFTLIEVLIAIALSAVIVSGVLITIGTASKMLVRTKNQDIAKDIASTEMEYVRSQVYSAGYSLLPISSMPASYSNFSCSSASFTSPLVTPLQLGEQKIEIDVFMNGSTTPIYTLVDYRVSY